MKVFVTLSALFAVALAAGYENGGYPSGGGGGYQQVSGGSSGGHYSGGSASAAHPPIPIIKSDSQLNHDGSYQFEYETGNGISAAEQGYVKNAGHKDAEIQVAQGYFHYTSDDGTPISLKYIADENGFQPIGDHLPTPPPVPKEIAEALANHQDDGDDGQYHGEQGSAGQYHAQPQQHQQYQAPQQQQQQYYKY